MDSGRKRSLRSSTQNDKAIKRAQLELDQGHEERIIEAIRDTHRNKIPYAAVAKNKSNIITENDINVESPIIQNAKFQPRVILIPVRLPVTLPS